MVLRQARRHSSLFRRSENTSLLRVSGALKQKKMYSGALFYRDKFNVKNESRVCGDRTDCTRPVAEFRRNDEVPFTANLHTENTLFPTLNNITSSQHKLDRFSANKRAVEFGAICKRTYIMDAYRLARECFRPSSHNAVFDY